MTRIVIKHLVWDDYNKKHIKKHNVTVEDIEKVSKSVIIHKKAKKGRYLITGRVGKRLLSAIISRKGIGIYYPITARDAAKRERRSVYEKEKI